ncbi:hypothetical protein JJQ59_15150 [Cupriavidus necator]|uniref:Uncharacterized protein n=1 Tax=Cupriavidus necator TaxID=106590 RepID=A0A367PIB3_CUPNE|nr:hypothetical protein [Cupriavidus necator]QQX83739.1 hypothetical protein JJQ59_15150 [Cupriavidus necator]RCJ07304.1 hypothetical protein DDK22_16620 [Cupriavidus necator]
MSAKKKPPPEAVSGSYTPIPHVVLDSTAFRGASIRAKAMLFEVLRQHTGRNNGHLQLSEGWLKKRGWKSSDQVQKAKAELVERGLILKTRQGGRSIGPDWFALTWLAITDFTGLDIRRGGYQPGLWRMMDPAPAVKISKLRIAAPSDEGTVAAPPCGVAPHRMAV